MSPLNGGNGYTPRQVGDMTLDQIYMCLADPKNLRKSDQIVREYDTLAAVASLADKDGKIKGRAGDGTPITGTFKGKSKVQRIREELAAKKELEAKEAEKAKSSSRRGRRNK